MKKKSQKRVESKGYENNIFFLLFYFLMIAPPLKKTSQKEKKKKKKQEKITSTHAQKKGQDVLLYSFELLFKTNGMRSLFGKIKR